MIMKSFFINLFSQKEFYKNKDFFPIKKAILSIISTLLAINSIRKKKIFPIRYFQRIMNRNFIPLNKRTTEFDACPITPPITKPDVVIDPDPPVAGKLMKFTVSGKLDHDITAGTTILGIGFADSAKNPLGDPYSETFTESFKAGEQFSKIAEKVPTPAQLPDSYYIGVIIGDPPQDPKAPFNLYGCASAAE